jgi:hypothetical protein
MLSAASAASAVSATNTASGWSRASVKSPRKLLTAFQDSSNFAPSWSILLFHRETKLGRRRFFVVRS